MPRLNAGASDYQGPFGLATQGLRQRDSQLYSTQRSTIDSEMGGDQACALRARRSAWIWAQMGLGAVQQWVGSRSNSSVVACNSLIRYKSAATPHRCASHERAQAAESRPAGNRLTPHWGEVATRPFLPPQGRSRTR